MPALYTLSPFLLGLATVDEPFDAVSSNIPRVSLLFFVSLVGVVFQKTEEALVFRIPFIGSLVLGLAISDDPVNILSECYYFNLTLGL